MRAIPLDADHRTIVSCSAGSGGRTKRKKAYFVLEALEEFFKGDVHLLWHVDVFLAFLDDIRGIRTAQNSCFTQKDTSVNEKITKRRCYLPFRPGSFDLGGRRRSATRETSLVLNFRTMVFLIRVCWPPTACVMFKITVRFAWV
jgi:hypothetical protein